MEKADNYCEDTTKPKRRPTRYSFQILYSALFHLFNVVDRTVVIGPTLLGSDHPVAKQTMTTTNTKDVESSVKQVTIM